MGLQRVGHDLVVISLTRRAQEFELNLPSRLSQLLTKKRDAQWTQLVNFRKSRQSMISWGYDTNKWEFRQAFIFRVKNFRQNSRESCRLSKGGMWKCECKYGSEIWLGFMVCVLLVGKFKNKVGLYDWGIMLCIKNGSWRIRQILDPRTRVQVVTSL